MAGGAPIGRAAVDRAADERLVGCAEALIRAPQKALRPSMLRLPSEPVVRVKRPRLAALQFG